MSSRLIGGLRRLRRGKITTVVMIATLAGALAALTASYAVLDRVVLRPLPYPDSHELLWLGHDAPGLSFSGLAPPPGLQRHYLNESHTLESLGSWSQRNSILRGHGAPERTRTIAATAGLFTALGVQPLTGRLFDAADDHASSPDVVLIGETFARAHFDSSEQALGESLELDGVVHTVVGVLPSSFSFPDPRAQLWIDADLPTEATTFGAFGGSESLARRRAGVRVEDVKADLDARIAELTRRVSPEERRLVESAALTSRPIPLAERVLGTSARTPWLLFCGLAALFVVTVFNLLQLALARRRLHAAEESVRSVLGAGAGDRLRRNLAEYALIVAPATVLGGLLAHLLLAAFLRQAAGQLPRLHEVSLGLEHVAVLAFTGFAVTLVLAFGLSVGRPARLRGAQQAALVAPPRWPGGVLLGGQLAMLSLLLMTTAVFAVGFGRLLAVDTGIDAANLYRFSIELPKSDYEQPEAVRAFHAALLSGLESSPGVGGVCASTALPLEGVSGGTVLTLPGTDAAELPPLVSSIAESAGCSSLFGGASTEALGAEGILVSHSLARTYWPEGDVVGRQVRVGPEADDPLKAVAGITENRPTDLLDLAPAVFFEPLDGVPGERLRTLHYAFRASSHAEARDLARRRVDALDRSLPLDDLAAFDRIFVQRTAGTRLPSTILLATSLLALAVCGGGIFGMTAHGTASRAREMAVRGAVGAAPGDLLRETLTQTAIAAGLGSLAGGAAALAARGALDALILLGPSPLHRVVAAVIVSVIGLTLLAAWWPARRAAHSSPAAVLRRD